MEQLLLPLLLMLALAIPLILGSRRQKRVMQEQQQLQQSLTEGDRVMTTSGMYATVADITAEDTIDLEIAPGVVTTWLRQAVREKVVAEADEATDSDEETGDLTDAEVSAEKYSTQSTAQLAPSLEDQQRK